MVGSKTRKKRLLWREACSDSDIGSIWNGIWLLLPRQLYVMALVRVITTRLYSRILMLWLI